MLSAFFSGMETAFISISKLRVKYLVKKRVKNAIILERLKNTPKKLLILILLGNNIVNIGASALATSIAINHFGNIGVGVATGFMTFFILVFGEIAPKSYCTMNAEKIALFMAPFIDLLMKILYPFVLLFHEITELFNKLSGNSKKPLITEDELMSIVNIGEEIGTIKKDEREMIKNIFDFDDVEVSHIMIPRSEIFAIDIKNKIKDIKEEIIKSGFSRIPIYDGDLDNLKGVLFVKDMLAYKDQELIANIIRQPVVIPYNRKLNDVFYDMKRKKMHIAMVVDEYGTLTGIVTIEDLLEEIVGDIYDETDVVKVDFTKTNKGFLVDGLLELEDLFEKAKIRLDGDQHKTISSYLIENIGYLPEKNDTFFLEGYNFLVKNVSHNRIDKIEIIVDI